MNTLPLKTLVPAGNKHHSVSKVPSRRELSTRNLACRARKRSIFNTRVGATPLSCGRG